MMCLRHLYTMSDAPGPRVGAERARPVGRVGRVAALPRYRLRPNWSLHSPPFSNCYMRNQV